MNSEALRIRILTDVLKHGECIVTAELIGNFVLDHAIEAKAHELAAVNHLHLTRLTCVGQDQYTYKLPDFDANPCPSEECFMRDTQSEFLNYNIGQGESMYMCGDHSQTVVRYASCVTLAVRGMKMSLRFTLDEAMLFLAESNHAIQFERTNKDNTGRECIIITVYSSLYGPSIFRTSRRVYADEFYAMTGDAIAATVTEFAERYYKARGHAV